jgi:hypothetical protein
MIVQTPNLWSFGHIRVYRQKSLFIAQQYPKLWNVTIGKVFDQQGCGEANMKGLLEGKDFKNEMLDLAAPNEQIQFLFKLYPTSKLPFCACIHGEVPELKLGLFLLQLQWFICV